MVDTDPSPEGETVVEAYIRTGGKSRAELTGLEVAAYPERPEAGPDGKRGPITHVTFALRTPDKRTFPSMARMDPARSRRAAGGVACGAGLTWAWRLRPATGDTAPMDQHLLEADSAFDVSTQATTACLTAGLDDQLRRLKESVDGLSVEALEWQSAPGMNSIGILLAHLALVEVYWIKCVPEGTGKWSACDATFRDLVGIGAADDAIPLAADGAHPEALRGLSLDDYLTVLDRARACVHGVLHGVDGRRSRHAAHRRPPGAPRAAGSSTTCWSTSPPTSGRCGSSCISCATRDWCRPIDGSLSVGL